MWCTARAFLFLYLMYLTTGALYWPPSRSNVHFISPSRHDVKQIISCDPYMLGISVVDELSISIICDRASPSPLQSQGCNEQELDFPAMYAVNVSESLSTRMSRGLDTDYHLLPPLSEFLTSSDYYTLIPNTPMRSPGTSPR